MNDQPTEARMRQIIRQIVDQEVRRLQLTDTELADQVDLNTELSENNQRRGAARNNDGLVSSKGFSLIDASALVVTEHARGANATWDIQVPVQPIQITLWSQSSVVSSAQFDTFQFDTTLFDGSVVSESVVTTGPAVVYTPGAQTLTINWGSPKTGTIYLHNFGSGTAWAVVAVSD